MATGKAIKEKPQVNCPEEVFTPFSHPPKKPVLDAKPKPKLVALKPSEPEKKVFAEQKKPVLTTPTPEVPEKNNEEIKKSEAKPDAK